MFKVVKRYYGLGIYNNANVAKFVISKAITEEQYTEITGEKYILA
jgi:uncharacterized XkdX family phage protein